MKIDKVKSPNKAYSISDFKIGDLCIGVSNEHIYLVVLSENDKKQLVDLTSNSIIRVGTMIPLLPCTGTLKITSIG